MSAEPTHSKVIILGSGPAGATAAIYAARAMLEPTLIAGLQPGGQLTITTEVENYPGFAEAIQGPWLMEQMQAQAEHVGTKLVQDTIASVDLGAPALHPDRRSAATRYTADTLIIATGASANWLGLPSEQQIPGLRRLGLRHLRRLLLSRQGGRGGRRRQHRCRGSAVPDQFRLQGDADPSPRRAARRQDQPDAPGRPIPRSRSSTTPVVEECWAPHDPLGRDGRSGCAM